MPPLANRWKPLFLFASTLGVFGSPLPAQIVPPEYNLVTAGDVDPRTGSFTLRMVDLSAGSGPFPMSLDLTRFYNTSSTETYPYGLESTNWQYNRFLRPFGVDTYHSLSIYLILDDQISPVADQSYTFVNGMESSTFDSSGHTLDKKKGQLFYNSYNDIRVVDGSGTSYHFSTSNPCQYGGGQYCYGPDYVEAPNGARADFIYQNGVLARVVTTTGYKISFAYQAGPVTGDAGTANGLLISAAILSKTTCPASQNACPGDVILQQASYAYTKPAGAHGFVLISNSDAQANSTSYAYDNQQQLTDVFYPGLSSSIFHNVYDQTRVHIQQRPDGSSITYNYSSYVEGASEITDVLYQDGTSERYVYGLNYHNSGYPYVRPKPDSQKDRINRFTNYTYDYANFLQTRTDPEGNVTTFVSDLRGNVIETRVGAKPSATSGDIVTYSTFPSSCTAINFRICAKPTKDINSLGHATEYSWDASHGGLLYMTSGRVGSGSNAGQCTLASGVCPSENRSYTSFTGLGGQVFHLVSNKVQSISSSESVSTNYIYDSDHGYNLKAETIASGSNTTTTCFENDLSANTVSKTSGRGVCP
jgi:YD repeat-containing protein